MTSEGVTAAANGQRRPAPRSADWGGKALLVCALAVLMAIPGLFVFALIADRTHRADTVVEGVSAQQGGTQQLLGPMLVVPYSYLNDDKHLVQGWYVVSPDEGQAKVTERTETLHKGIFDVPTYNATADLDATFGAPPASLNLPASASVDWSQAAIVVGFSDLRGAKTNVAGDFAGSAGKTALAFAPSSAINLGSAAQPSGLSTPLNSAGFGLVAAPAAPLLAAKGGDVHVTLRFTGAQRVSVLPFAKTTHVTVAGAWKAPSFDGGFLPESRSIKGDAFTATWNVPFIARGLSDHASASDLSLNAMGTKDVGVTFARANNPYENVMRALKYAVMFVGLVFLTFFVFEALSGRRVHPAQYVLIGLAQMVFYLLLLSLSEWIGFDLAFLVAAVATVGLIAGYAQAAFRSRVYGLQALAIFSAVYGLIYLLMRLEDFALLAGSIASFIGLAIAMYLTRHIDWYGGRAETATLAQAGAAPPPA